MNVAAGTHLGPYEVLARIGEGGMGEVYKARDTRLDREVAIKVLPAEYSRDASRLQRFQQEARAAGVLNHPNILAIHDVGETEGRAPYLVSELLDGETLRERLASGALPVRKAVDAAVQTARGLSAAHARGIVHRDLKPENLFLTRDGHIKILDFGLAKLIYADPSTASVSREPTTAPPTTIPRPDAPVLTEPGVILGTVGYMSPEQVRAGPADHRADVFAFGAILFEMLSGARAFQRETTAETMTAILKEEVAEAPLAARQIAPALARIVYRCLEKDPAQRFQSAGDLGFALEGLSSASEIPRAAIDDRRRDRSSVWRWVAAGIGVLAVVALTLGLTFGLTTLRSSPVQTPLVRATIPVPAGLETSDLAIGPLPGRLALSPDGRHLAFIARNAAPAGSQLWVRSLDSDLATPLEGTGGATYPFWSPDSNSIGFLARGELRRVARSGGAPATIASVRSSSGVPAGLGWASGATWGPGDVILFTLRDGTPVQRISASGGAASPVASIDTAAGEVGHGFPSFLPDGRHFLYAAIGRDGALGVNVGSLDGTAPTRLMDGGSNASFANGHLLFMRGRTLVAQPFDPVRIALTGTPTPIAERVMLADLPFTAFSASQGGTLVYLSGERLEGSRLIWRDRTGKAVGTLADRAHYRDLQLSPDGRYVSVSLTDPNDNSDLWSFDLRRGVPTKFISDPSTERALVWSPDGSRTIFNARRHEGPEGRLLALYEKAANGVGAESLVLAEDANLWPESWSPDGRYLLYSRVSSGGAELKVLPLAGERKEPYRLFDANIRTDRAQFSPDGRWIAYSSNEAGGSEVFVTSFPGRGRRVRVSVGGGSWPQWRRDGSELFYLASGPSRSQFDNALMAVDVDTRGTEVTVGVPRELMQALISPLGLGTPYVVTQDGQQFLVNTPALDSSSLSLSLVVNWPTAIARK